MACAFSVVQKVMYFPFSVVCYFTHLMPGRMNGALRVHSDQDEGNSLIKPFMPYLRLLLNALNKMPLVETTAYRGVGVQLDEVWLLVGWIGTLYA